MHRRILLLNTDLEIGGTPTVVRELALRLREPGRVHVEVACLAGWGPVAEQLAERGVHVTAFGAAGAYDVRVVHKLNRLVRSRLCDTVFSFLVHANAVAAVSRVFLRDVRFVQSIQTTQPEPRWHWEVQRLAQRAARAVVVPSESVAEAARAWSGVPGEKIVVIPNAIEPGEFAGNLAAQPDPSPFPIGFIGRLDPVKRVPELVRAFSSLVQTWKRDAHLHIYGLGRDEGRIRGEIEKLGLRERVTMHGAVRRPQDALKDVRLLVLPSQAEGFGLVLIEAMAAGVPVVGTNVAGIRDVIRDNETGVLVEAAHPGSLAMVMQRVIEDRGLRERLIANGLVEARERFSWGRVIPMYRKVLGIEAACTGDEPRRHEEREEGREGDRQNRG